MPPQLLPPVELEEDELLDDELLLEEEELLLDEDELLEDELLEPGPVQAASASANTQDPDSLNKVNWLLVILIPHRLVKDNYVFIHLAQWQSAICMLFTARMN